jgi:hypothetical protein
MHPAAVPIFAGGAIGTLALIGTTVLVVYCRRRRGRGRGRGTPSDSKAVSRRWFTSDEKEGVVICIHVPPPTVPLKGILIQNPAPFPPTPSDPHPDRVSLTSSQFSVILNNLPKSYDSGLEDGVLDEVREGDRGSPIRPSRIGPSPSDFLANLFGHGDNFTPSTSAASEDLTSPSSPPLSPPQSPPYAVASTVPHRDGFPLPPANTFTNPPTPTFPPATASPSLGIASGPRGHGLVLTGDQNGPISSFAQWHYQRTAARGRGENIGGFEQPP